MLSMLLVIAVLFTGTELRQLLKLPALVLHFMEHTSNDPSMSLGGFLWMHYMAEEVHDEDWSEDEKLPFRSFIASPIVPVALPVAGMPRVTRMQGLAVVLAPTFESADLSAGSAGEIWQPPKRG